MLTTILRTYLRVTIVCIAAPLGATAAEPAAAPFETPSLEHVLTVRATIEAPLAMGKTPHGERRVIVIRDGTFEGKRCTARTLLGGKYWQLVRGEGVTQLEARYWLREEDGTVIRVLNQVLVNPPPPGAPADAKRYTRSSVTFEAPVGKHDWLNK